LILQYIFFPSSWCSERADVTFVNGKLSRKDLSRLRPGRWLNDELINWGLKYVDLHGFVFLFSFIHHTFRHWCLDELRTKDRLLASSITLLTTFFYEKLRSVVSVTLCQPSHLSGLQWSYRVGRSQKVGQCQRRPL
jgi:hypothetical protein